MSIDLPTMQLTASVTGAVLGLLCLVLAQTDPALRPLRLSGLGSFCFAVGIPLLLLRGGPYRMVGIVLGNGIIFMAWGLQVAAVRRLAGNPAQAWLAPAAAGAWAAACLVPAFMASFPARAIVASGLSWGFATLLAWELGRAWTGWRPLRVLIPVLFGIHPLLLGLRVAATALHGTEGANSLNSAVFLSGLADIWACGLILITEATRRASRHTQATLAAAHAAIATSRDDLAQIVEALPAVVYRNRITPDLRWTRSFLGANTERVIGWPRDQLGADDSLEARTEWAPAEMRAALQELTSRGAIVVEVRMRRPDGTLVWVRRESRIARRHPDGSVEVVGTITDISRERALAAQVQSSARLASLGEMATGLAHELGQPASIMGLAATNAAQALRTAGAAAIPDALRRLDRIIGQAGRMGGLMQHLKAFARVEPLSLGPVDLAQVVAGALVLTEATLRQDQIALELAMPDRLPAVQGQLVPLEQVLVNLLLNARDAILGRPAGTPRWIRLAAAPARDGRVAMTVADSGGGIDPATLPRLFEPFVTTKPLGEGLGLGLSVSHGLISGMGGSIGVAQGAEGAVFTVTLVRAPVLVAA